MYKIDFHEFELLLPQRGTILAARQRLCVSAYLRTYVKHALKEAVGDLQLSMGDLQLSTELSFSTRIKDVQECLLLRLLHLELVVLKYYKTSNKWY